MSDPQSVEKTESTVPAAPAQNRLLRQLLSSNPLLIFLSCVLAFALSSVLIVLANEDARQAAGYFFARPGDFLSAAWGAIVEALSALVRGAVFDWTKDNPQQMLRPLTESLTNAVPLILAGLGLAVGFRAGLFNIGAQGQLLAGATLATWVSLHTTLPAVVALPLALLAAATGGALWASIAGVLKARTGANEVIVTIMLNSIAFFGVQYLLTKETFIGEGNSNPKSLPIPEAAQYPRLLGDSFRLHWGFLVALAAAGIVWWLLERSTWGFEFRAIGFNPHAARTAGISVNRVTVAVMAVAGALAGLAGTAPILATEKALTDGVAGSYGFDAITVALLGRSRPWGTVMAGILFGALRAGGTLMQTATKTPIDIVLVVQSIIVLLIAAPPLVRTIFRLPAPEPKRQEVAA